MNLPCATITTLVFPLTHIKRVFNFTRLLLTLIWKGIWKSIWELLDSLVLLPLSCHFIIFSCVKYSLNLLNPSFFVSEHYHHLLDISLTVWFFYSAGMSVARCASTEASMSLHLQITLWSFWLQNIYHNLYYEAMSLPVLAKLHAPPAALFKQGLLGLPVIFEQRRWHTIKHLWPDCWNLSC